MSDNKVLGLEPVKYVKIAYILLLVSGVLGLLNGLMGLASVPLGMGFGGLANLAGIIGLLMAVIGWAAFKDKFAALEVNHMQYIVVVFVTFLFLGIIFGSFLLMSPAAGIIFLIIGVIQLLMFFTGYNSWTHARTISKDNVQGEVKSALSRS